MESLFYIGQRIVAIKNHEQKDFKKGDEFIIIDIKKGCCNYIIRINSDRTDGLLYCNKCNIDYKEYIYMYYYQSYFAPIQEIGNMTFDEAIKLVEPKTTLHKEFNLKP